MTNLKAAKSSAFATTRRSETLCSLESHVRTIVGVRTRFRSDRLRPPAPLRRDEDDAVGAFDAVQARVGPAQHLDRVDVQRIDAAQQPARPGRDLEAIEDVE